MTVSHTGQRNCSIDIFRLFFAISAIFNHTRALSDIDIKLYYFFGEYIPRCTIPFFLGVSGYYYIKALLAGKKVLRKQLSKLVPLYTVWVLIYYEASFIQNILIKQETLFPFLLERVQFYFLNGGYAHLWYFPAMIYATLIFTIFHRLWGEKGLFVLSCTAIPLYLIGVFGSAYIDIGMRIPVLSILYKAACFGVFRSIFCIGIPYFAIGFWLVQTEKRIDAMSQKALSALVLVATGLLLLEFFVLVFILQWVDTPNMVFSLYPFSFFFIAFLLNRPMANLMVTSWYARRLASAIYLAHPLILIGLEMSAAVINLQIPATLVFLLVCSIALLFGLILIKMNNRLSSLLIGFAPIVTR